MPGLPAMSFSAVFTASGMAKLGQIIVGDLTMAGDNVVIMGSLASGLPERDRRRVLMLGVVFVPFPTALLGENLLTHHASPAVVLYNAVIAIQGVAWVLVSGSAIKDGLARSEQGAAQIHAGRRNGYVAFAGYALLAILAFWFPMPVAIVTTLTWVFWLVFGISIRHD